MKYRKLSELKKLPNNPRVIKDRDFQILCESIKNNPEYFEARPLILSNRTGELIIIAGNQRYEAAKHLKLKEVPTYLIEGLSEEKEREIIIRDNVNNGQWDWDELANSWNVDELEGWGVNVQQWDNDIDLDKFFEEDNTERENKNKIVLEYTQEDYDLVIDAFSKHSGSKEQIIYKLLGL